CRPATAAVPLTGARERSLAPQLVVLLPLGRAAQDVVRLVDLLEAVGSLRIVGITIGVVLLGEAAKRFLDLVGRRRLGHAEDLVIVSLRSHLLPVHAPPCFTSLPLQHDHPCLPDDCVAHPISGLPLRPPLLLLALLICRSR